MKTSSLKIDCVYTYRRDGGLSRIKYLGMDEDKYKFAPMMANGKQFGVSGRLTEREVTNFVSL